MATTTTANPSTLLSPPENDSAKGSSSNVSETLSLTPEDIEKIESLRERFFKETAKKPEKYYPEDIEMVREDDWWTLRFIKWNRGNEDKSIRHMLSAFKWRKSFGIRDRTISDLPIEFAKAAAIFPWGYDYKGRAMIYIRVKVYRKISQLTLFFQQFVAGIVDHVDKEAGCKGFVILFDVTGMGLINVDFDFLQFLIQLLQNYYPYGQRYAICYNVPRIVRPMWSMAKIFLGSAEKTFRFCNEEELKKYIPAEYLLRYMGGECDFDFTSFEETRDCPSVRDLAEKFGFTQAEVDKYYKIFEPNLIDAQILAKGQKI